MPGWVSAVRLATAVLGTCACTAAPTRAALQGDLTSLKAAVTEAEHKGELGGSAVRELAGAVLERELLSLPEPVESFPEVRACARSMRAALRELADGSGERAELASLALLDAGFEAPRARRSEGGADRQLLRARLAVGPRAGAERRQLLLHGDAIVRRAALEAAALSGDPKDVPALLEVARLDPDEQSRSLAVRALGVLGGRRVVLGLSDLWSGAGTERRLEIVAAWANPATFAAGGERQIVRTAEQTSGTAAVAAALVLARRGAGPPGLATTLLARALGGSDSSARWLALYEAPWRHAELRELILAAQRSEDPTTRLLSLLRQAEHGALDPTAQEQLRSLAAERDTARGVLARVTLARLGDAAVKPALLSDLKASRARQRMLAAFGLVLLEEWGSAAHALGDDSPEVRQVVACHVLADPDPEQATKLERERARAFGPFAVDLTRLLAPRTSGGG